MNGIIAGDDDDGLGGALEAGGADLTHVEGVATRPRLEEAGVHDAELFVLTDLDQATAIPIAKNLNEALRVVVYSEDSLPEFVRGIDVLKIDPRLLDPDAVAEELLNGR